MLDTQNLESMRGMFASCERLQSLDIKSFDTSNVSDMSGLFANCHSLGTIEWSSKFVTAKVTDMTSMFGSCESFEELYIEGFDTSNVTNMYGMFADCFKLKTLKFGEKFDTSQVTDMGIMFAEDYELTELDLSGFNTSKVENMIEMFCECKKLTKLNLSSFDTANVKDMQDMFGLCENLKELDLSSFTISADTDAEAFFCDTYSLNYIVTPKKCDASVMVPPRGEWKDVNGTVYTSLPRTSKKISNNSFKKEFTITYELNGGTNNKANPSSYKSSLTVTLKNPSKAGYTFAGWFDNAEFSGEKIKTVKAKDITLYAKWTANVYIVTFNGNGGNYTPEGAKKATATKKQSFTYDESANLEANVFARKGYTFTGWNTKKDGKGKAYEPGAEVLNLTKTNKGNINLYAQWKANEYTIHFDINAEEVYIGDHTGNMDDVTVKYAKTVKLPANNFTKKGYSFKGWSTDANATKAQYKNKASVKNLAIEDGKVVTLYAVWSINTYNVKFVANGGKGKTFTIKGCKYGEKLIKWPENTFTNKDLYTFGGWVVGNFVYPVGQEANLEATKNNQTFTASAAWLFDIEICIGEENKIIENAIYNSPVSIEEFEYYLPELAKTGYYLAGFATSKKNADKGKCAYTKSVKNVAGKPLYPVYKPIKYTVKFDKNAPEGAKVTGKMSNVSATYGKSFTLKANAFKCSGHTFLGWSTDKDAKEPEFTNKAKIEESLSVTNKDVVTLYAIWQDK